MTKMKSSINIKIDIGDFDVSQVEASEEVVKQSLWTGAGALKSRGVDSANLVLTFKANSEE